MHTRETFEDIRAYYEAHPEMTLGELAAHFNMNYNTLNAGFARHGLRNRDSRKGAYEIDPFGAAADDIRQACAKAIANQGSMSEGELNTLNHILTLIR